MWSWRKWQHERQVRKQAEQTMRLKKRSPLGSASATGAAQGGGELHPAAPPSLALLVQLGQLLDRQAPITLIVVGTRRLLRNEHAFAIIMTVRYGSYRVCCRLGFVHVVFIVVAHIYTKQIAFSTSFFASLFGGGGVPTALLFFNDSKFLHEVISFAWTGYYLEKKLGGLRLLLVLCYLLVLAQVLFAITAFILAKTFLTNGSIVQWRVGFSSVLWALKVVLNRQCPTLAPGLDISLPTSYMTWLELLGVHFFLPRLSLISQISGLAAGYLFTAIPGTMKLLAKYEFQVDRALRKQGIKLPVKHRWKLVLADIGHQIKALWPRCKK